MKTLTLLLMAMVGAFLAANRATGRTALRP
jgi:hypothetical protein